MKPALCVDDRGPALFLDEPMVEYMSDAAPFERAAWRWESLTPDRWTCSDLATRLSVSLTPARQLSSSAYCLRIDVDVLRPVRLARCVVGLSAPCAAPPFLLDRYLRWGPLTEPQVLGEYAPLAFSWAGIGTGYRLRSVRGGCAAEVDRRDGLLTVRLLLDGAVLHPRWHLLGGPRSEAAPTLPTGRHTSIELALSVDSAAAGTESAPAVAGRFPGGAEAALALTDHCDFDTRERLQLFLAGDGRRPGWRRRGLRLTKGAFVVASRPVDRAPAPSLEEPDYRRLLDELYQDGSEIAPHGLNESGDLDRDTFRRALGTIVQQFRPRTWLDHGLSQCYGYAMGGADRSTYDLLTELKNAGFTSLWSYQDVPADAVGSLNLLALQAQIAPDRWHQLGRHLRRGEWLVAVHYLRSLIRSATEGTAIGPHIGQAISTMRGIMMELRAPRPAAERLERTMRRLGSIPAELRRAAGPQRPEPYTRQHLLRYAPTLYPERAVPLRDARADELLLFTTLEVVHTSDVYTPEAVERLLAERGLHIGHCYLLNELPYLAGVFATGGGALALASPWIDFLDHLAAAVRAGRAWNPPMGDLAAWVRALQFTSVVDVARTTVRVDNASDSPVTGFTLLLPGSVSPTDVRWGDRAPAGHRIWSDWLAVWGDLPANGSTTVQWGGAQQ